MFTRQRIIFRYLTVMLVIGVFFAGYAKAAASAEPEVQRVVFISSPPGTSWYATTVGLSQIVNTYSDLKSLLRPITSYAAMPLYVKDGRADILFTPACTAYVRYRGLKSKLDPRAEGRPFPWERTLFGSYDFYNAYLTRADTGIKTIPDLRGKKVGIYFPAVPFSTELALSILRAYDLDPEKDVTGFKYPHCVIGVRDLIEGKIDAVCCSLEGPTVVELESRAGGIVLPVDPAKLGFLKKDYSPYTESVTIPTYVPCVQEPTPGVAFRVYFFCHKRMSEYVAYTVTKVITEHAKELAKAGGQFRGFGLDRAVPSDFFVPYHPGAIKYFKEKGIWGDKEDARNQKLLADVPKVPQKQ